MASANYLITPKNGFIQATSANTALDGSGTPVTVFTAATNAVGSRIDRVVIHATGTTTAGMIRFFLVDSGGSTIRLIREVPVVAITPSATQPAFSTVAIWDNGLILANGVSLRATTEKSETFNIIPVVAGDFV